MFVSNLQQFLRLLAPPLAAAGINQTAQKSVTGSLESVASALEPFQEMSLNDLAELLRVAQEFRQTGQLPDWVMGKKRRPPGPAPPGRRRPPRSQSPTP